MDPVLGNTVLWEGVPELIWGGVPGFKHFLYHLFVFFAVA